MPISTWSDDFYFLNAKGLALRFPCNIQLLNLQGILFFDRMTDEVRDSIRTELEVSKPCLFVSSLFFYIFVYLVYTGCFPMGNFLNMH